MAEKRRKTTRAQGRGATWLLLLPVALMLVFLAFTGSAAAAAKAD